MSMMQAINKLTAFCRVVFFPKTLHLFTLRLPFPIPGGSKAPREFHLPVYMKRIAVGVSVGLTGLDGNPGVRFTC
jgi:hypothetical protein